MARRAISHATVGAIFKASGLGSCRHMSKRAVLIDKRGTDVLHDPWFNKGTAFPIAERERLGIRGLLPPREMSLEEQVDRFVNSFRSLPRRTKEENESTALARWRILNRLHDRNETLYYKALIDNIKDMAPVIYTPTVGLVCQNFSWLFRRPRGMYFSAADRGEMVAMTYNWPAEKVDMIVVTDGSRILGLGDLGVQGIGIPIGKLDLYVAAAGISPQRVLPVMLDVGTNNEKLLQDPLYLGLRQNRLEGEEYLEVVDEFMSAVYTRWPNAIVQFEDFQNKWAFSLLQRYRTNYRMFNDDVQGTAGVALAGVLGAVRAQGRPMSDIAKQKIVVAGAGSAGLGVVSMLRQSMAMYLGGGAAAQATAAANFWLCDKEGLITRRRPNLPEDVKDFARSADESRNDGLPEGASILEVVRHVKPDILLGLSGVGGIFSKQVLQAMNHGGCSRPAIFPMSNPTSNAECTSDEAFHFAGPNVIFASGSPFPDVDVGLGKIGRANQGNNMYLFPGIGLGTLLSGARVVSDGMLHAAANKLASLMSDDSVQQGIIYPPISSIREITREVAAAVVRAAVDEDLADGYHGGNMEPKNLRQLSEGAISAYVEKNMWTPNYYPLIYVPPGVFRDA